jgi:hypothetical protein
VSRSLGACFSAVSAPHTTPLHNPTNSTTGGTGLTSPAIKLFFSTATDPTKIKRGYFGPLTFLDSQIKFKATFGLNPRVLPMKPSGSDTNNIQDLLRDLEEKCRLDIFMHLCMIDYVGHDKIDPALHVQDVSKQLGLLNQTHTYNGRTVELTPDELYNKCCALSVSLPEDAKMWPIQLCSLFLGVLTSDLSDHVTTKSGFSMPDITTLTTKALQLDALRSIRAYASKSYESLKKQKEKMKRMTRYAARATISIPVNRI